MKSKWYRRFALIYAAVAVFRFVRGWYTDTVDICILICIVAADVLEKLEDIKNGSI